MYCIVITNPIAISVCENRLTEHPSEITNGDFHGIPIITRMTLLFANTYFISRYDAKKSISMLKAIITVGCET